MVCVGMPFQYSEPFLGGNLMGESTSDKPLFADFGIWNNINFTDIACDMRQPQWGTVPKMRCLNHAFGLTLLTPGLTSIWHFLGKNRWPYFRLPFYWILGKLETLETLTSKNWYILFLKSLWRNFTKHALHSIVTK